MKLQAAGSRNAKKDYWDIATLLNHFTLKEMVDVFKTKFPQIDEGYIIHSLTDFEEADKQFDPESLNGVTWEGVKQALTGAVAEFTRRSL